MARELLLGEIGSKVGGALRMLRDAVRCLFSPRAVGRSIKAGDEKDFKYRLNFALTMVGLTWAATALWLELMGLGYSNSRWFDVLFQFSFPLLTVTVHVLIYLMMRSFWLTSIRLSHFLQASLMVTGIGLLLAPIQAFIPSLFMYEFGHLPIEQIVGTVNPRLNYQLNALCGEKIASLQCLNLVAGLHPRFGTAMKLASFIPLPLLLIPTAIIVKTGTGIAYWRQAVGLLLFLIFFVIGVIGAQFI